MSQKKMFEIKCSDCGNTAAVPFKPAVGKPVYCRACFSKHKSKQQKSFATDYRSPRPKAWVRF